MTASPPPCDEIAPRLHDPFGFQSRCTIGVARSVATLSSSTMVAEHKPKIRFKPHFEVWETGPHEVTVRSNFNTLDILQGPLITELAPLLDGRWSRPDVVDRLGDGTNPLQADYTMSRLLDAGFLEEEPYSATPVDGLRQLGDQITGGKGIAPPSVALNIATTASILDSEITARCAELGLRIAEGGDVCLIVADDLLDDEIEALIEASLSRGAAVLVAVIAPGSLWVGPVFQRGHGTCWRCTRARVQAARPTLPGNARLVIPARTTAPPFVSAAIDAITAAAATLGARGPHPDLESTILTVNLANLEVERHVVVPRPPCRVCSRKVLPPDTPVQPDPPAPVGYRAARPEDLLRSLRYHLSSVAGIVGNLAPHRSDFAGGVNIRVATVRDARDRSAGQRGLTSRCAGTGRTAAAARLSAVCEALERYSGLDHGNEKYIQASYAELGGDAIHPASCLLFSDLQYEDRQRLNRAEADSNYIPHPFDENRTILWTPLRSFRNGAERFLPAAMCYYDGLSTRDHDFCRADSNGCAAGSTFDEAILHGVFELVERDAAAIWWYNRLQRPGIDLSSIEDPEFRPVPDLCRKLGLECWALDVTTDLGIPAYAALCGRPNQGHSGGAIGFGAHIDPKIALRRALSEMSQLLANRLPNGSSALFFTRPPDGVFLKPAPSASAIRPDSLPGPPASDLDGALDHCVKAVTDAGLDLLVLDQTRPGVGLHVARVVAPGLRPFWARFAPGRLYDVPVEMGWLRSPYDEAHLNPSHLTV